MIEIGNSRLPRRKWKISAERRSMSESEVKTLKSIYFKLGMLDDYLEQLLTR